MGIPIITGFCQEDLQASEQQEVRRHGTGFFRKTTGTVAPKAMKHDGKTRLSSQKTWVLGFQKEVIWDSLKISEVKFSKGRFICVRFFAFSLENDRGLTKNDTPRTMIMFNSLSRLCFSASEIYL